MSAIKAGDSVNVRCHYWDHAEAGQVVSVTAEAITVALGGGVLSFDIDTRRSSDERWGAEPVGCQAIRNPLLRSSQLGRAVMIGLFVAIFIGLFRLMLLMVKLMIFLAFALVALLVSLFALATGNRVAARHHWHRSMHWPDIF